MLKGTFLGAIALVGLFALSQADSSGEMLPNRRYLSNSMAGPRGLLYMKRITVDYCKEEELMYREDLCEMFTDLDQRSVCIDLFSKQIKLCDEYLNSIVAKTFATKQFESLFYEYQTIDDRVANPLTKELRANIEKYFNDRPTYWDIRDGNPDRAGVFNRCHEFIVQFQPIRTIMEYSGRTSLFRVGLEATRAMKVHEFCKVFTEQYFPKSTDLDMYMVMYMS